MDITKFIISRRNDALLAGDYGAYRQRCSRRLLTIRRKLGLTTPKGKKYAPKDPVTQESISKNPELVQLILLTAERAWAHAMYMKSMHVADASEAAVRGSTKTHIVSRLRKAEKTASRLVDLLKADEEQTEASKRATLEAGAYRSLLHGNSLFEAQKWQKCLQAYSEVYVVYTALANHAGTGQGDAFRELLSSIIEPSIRYAAYQLRLPRTLAIARIVVQSASKDSEDVKVALKIDPDAMNAGPPGIKSVTGQDIKDIPKTISWRSRTVNLEDANIAQALAAVSNAEQKLSTFLVSAKDSSRQNKAAAYDGVLNPSQDAVDATKTAIEEVVAEGLAQGDPRVQALQITRTAVNYALVGWRIGRNRVLCGPDDGAHLGTEFVARKRKGKTGGQAPQPKEEGNGKKLSRLRERLVLYDTTLQSLDSVKELPGVAADQDLMDELGSKKAYFSALRCLSIARSHALLGNTKNALALFARAQTLAAAVSTNHLPSTSPGGPVSLEVTSEQTVSLQRLLQTLVSQYRALVELDNLQAEAASAHKAKVAAAAPLIERLDEYPVNGADLKNLVIYPPRIRPVPVKPIFLDVAWNYIEYPGRAKQAVITGAGPPKVEEKKEGRKGWFGFGR